VTTPPLYPIEVTGLAKAFAGNRVLRGVNFRVQAGQVVVLMGPSGSGKTTLLRSLNFLEVPDEGTVQVCGITLTLREGVALNREARQKVQAIRQRTSMVFQSFNLFPHRTALENVTEGPIAVKKISKAAAIKRGMQLLTRVGLAEKAHEYPARLSGGQKQRVAIARSLAMDPEVILFDEPTSALDPELRDDVLQVMRDLANEGMTMLVVTHETRFARDVADRVVFMEGGVIMADASSQDFFERLDDPRIARFLSRVRAGVSGAE
jgi:cystine transport system ATP-binding protein